jgi:hypothetical protein|tara:strand:+ start:220 stop:495 length:276 start_codon:yes stop_codon:yes gene_type:complete
MIDYLIKKWQLNFGITDWQITTEKIDSNQIIYNGETYFIGIERDFKKKEGIIYHDIDLCEESIIHELLHVKSPDKDEDWVNNKTNQLLNLI